MLLNVPPTHYIYKPILSTSTSATTVDYALFSVHPCFCCFFLLFQDPAEFRFIVIFCRMLLFFARMLETTEYQLRRYRFVTKMLLKNMIRLHSPRLLTCSFIRSMSHLSTPYASSSYLCFFIPIFLFFFFLISILHFHYFFFYV